MGILSDFAACAAASSRADETVARLPRRVQDRFLAQAKRILAVWRSHSSGHTTDWDWTFLPGRSTLDEALALLRAEDRAGQLRHLVYWHCQSREAYRLVEPDGWTELGRDEPDTHDTVRTPRLARASYFRKRLVLRLRPIRLSDVLAGDRPGCWLPLVCGTRVDQQRAAIYRRRQRVYAGRWKTHTGLSGLYTFWATGNGGSLDCRFEPPRPLPPRSMPVLPLP